MEIELQAEIFRAIGDETRLRILRELPTEPKCKKMFNIAQLVEKLGGSQPNMTRHLQVLKRAGLVHCKKKCASVFYWRDPEAFDRTAAALQHLGSSTIEGKD